MEKKIILRNSSIVITNYELGDSPKLESYFKIFDRITFSESYKAMKYDEERKLLFLPRGLDINLIQRYLDCDTSIAKDFSSDPYIQGPDIKIKYLPRDDVQKEALTFILGRGQYSDNVNAGQLSVNLPTGKGKTYVSIAAMSFWSARTLVIASTTGWLEQWKNCVGEYTNLNEKSDVLTIAGSPTIHKIMNDIIDVSKYTVFLMTHSTINNFASMHGWDKVSELFKKLNIFLKIYDEAHLNFDNIALIDFNTNTKKTIYLTATPGRSDRIENFIYQLYFKNIPDINLFNEDEDPHTRYTAIRFNSRPSPQDMRACANNAYGLDRNAYVNHIVCCNAFYDMMYIVMDKIFNMHGKVLVYIGTNSAIEIVKDWIEENYPEFRGDVGVYTSVIPKEIKQEQLNKRIILSTTKSAGAALDIKDLRATIILAEPFKSDILAKQTLGRTRNPNTDCLEIVDDGFKQITRFYKAKLPVYDKYATECREVKLQRDELAERADRLYRIREKVKKQYEMGYAIIDYTL